MPEPIRIQDIARHVGDKVTLQVWLYNRTDKGKLQFLQVRDGTGFAQCVVFKKEVSPEVFDAARSLTQESSFVVTGTVREDTRAPGIPGGYELGVTGLQVLQVSEDYPIQLKEHGVDFLMDNRHLWIRSQRQWAVLRVRATVIRAIRDWLDDNGFVNMDTPILTPAACEGTTTLFETDYFGEPAFLAQSGQLYNEADIYAFGRVYCFGPTFRAEKSKTRRHLTEFWMIEPEVAFAHLDDAMSLAEQLIAFVVERVLEKRRSELQTLGRDVSKLEKCTPAHLPFPRLSYDDAVKRLEEKGSEIQWGGDFGGTDETILSENSEKPILVHRYPSQVKAFYMAPDPARPEVALCVDVLAPEGYGEIVGGGERIADEKLLLQRIEENKLPRQAFEWYLDLRRYGSVPHAGFGMGIERVVAWICGLEHVRETIPFPRMLYRLTP